MNKRLARAATLLAMVGWSWMAPQPALAQLLPPLPIGSLIVTVTSPASGATVRDTVPVNASVSIVGSLTVANVEFFVDGNFIGSDSTASYSVSWNTRNVGNSSHSLTAVARDVLGVRWTSNPVTVTVVNDTTRPTVAITSPSNGNTVTGVITVAANASDAGGVTVVQFLLNGQQLGALDDTVPYEAVWDTRTVADGSHTLQARAQDTAGNIGESAVVTVTVSNGGAAVTRLEESAVIFDNNWVQRGSEVAAFSGGTAGSSAVPGATVTFSFTGTAVTWIGYKCTVCGIATVSIDGGPPTEVDTAGPDVPGTEDDNFAGQSEPVFAASGLAAGTHTLVITVTGNTTSGGAHIIIDAFDVTGGSASAVTRIIEDTDQAVSYTGAWIHGTDPIATSGTFAEAQVAGAVATLSFTGTEVSWRGYRYDGGGIARVSVDGTFVGEVDTYSASPELAEVFSAAGLTRGAHTLTIEVTGTRNPDSTDTWVIIDAFDVTP